MKLLHVAGAALLVVSVSTSKQAEGQAFPEDRYGAREAGFQRYVAEKSRFSFSSQGPGSSVNVVSTGRFPGDAREALGGTHSFSFTRVDVEGRDSFALSLVLAKPYDQGPRSPFFREDSGFSFMRFSLDGAGNRNRLELTKWWASSHARYDPNHREENHGWGFKYYYAVSENGKERWCVAVDTLRNTQDGRATSFGPCYQAEILEIKGIRLWVGGQLAFVSYGIPSKNGKPEKAYQGILPVPAISVEGPVTFTVGWIPFENVLIANSAMSASSLEDSFKKAGNVAGAFAQFLYRW